MSKIICTCNDISEEKIKDAIKHGVDTYDEMADLLDVGNICGSCVDDVKEIINKNK